MLWTIVRREVTANILSFRFLMGLLIYFFLIVTNLFVLTRGYEDRLRSYQTALRENENQIEQVEKYSEFGQIGQTRRLKCDRKLKLLSIFNEGVDKRKGNSVAGTHGSVPAVAEHHVTSVYVGCLGVYEKRCEIEREVGNRSSLLHSSWKIIFDCSR